MRSAKLENVSCQAETQMPLSLHLVFCLLVYSCFTDEESHLEEAESLPTWYSKVMVEGQSGQVPLGCRVWAPTLAPPTADTSRHKRPPLYAGSSLVGKAFSHRAQIGLPVLFTLRACFWPQQHHEARQPLPLHSGTLGHGSQPCRAPQVLLLGALEDICLGSVIKRTIYIYLAISNSH